MQQWVQGAMSSLGIHSDDKQKLSSIINNSVSTGSYTMGNNTLQQAHQVFDIMKIKSPTMSVGDGTYSEEGSPIYKVAFLTGPVDVKYQNANYAIYIKVLLPPGFPRQAPILSVINIDQSTFTINREYQGGLLPDETYKINLQSGNNWASFQNFDIMLTEMLNKLGSVFPFFRASANQLRRGAPPRHYPRSELATFGSNPSGQQQMQYGSNMGGMPHMGSPMQSNFGQPFGGGMGMHQMNGMPPNPNSYMYQNQGQGQSMNTQNNNQAPAQTDAHYKFIKEQALSLNQAIKMELNSDKKNFVEMATLVKENNNLSKQSEKFVKDLIQLNESNVNTKESLDNFKVQAQSIQVEKAILDGSLFNFANSAQMETLRLLSELESIREVSSDLVHIYIDGEPNNNIGFDEIADSVINLAKKEFTCKVKLNKMSY